MGVCQRQVFAAIVTSGAEEMSHFLIKTHFSLQNDHKIDGCGFRMAQIGAEIVHSLLLALHLHHGVWRRQVFAAIVSSGAEEVSHVLIKTHFSLQNDCKIACCGIPVRPR
jgi:hypothetical protein